MKLVWQRGIDNKCIRLNSLPSQQCKNDMTSMTLSDYEYIYADAGALRERK